VAQTVRASLRLAAGQADRVMRYQDARSTLQPPQQFAQPVELAAVDAAGSVPRPAIGRRRIDPHQPQGTDALGERIDLVADALTLLPGGKMLLEQARRRAPRAVIVIARHGKAWQRLGVAQSE